MVSRAGGLPGDSRGAARIGRHTLARHQVEAGQEGLPHHGGLRFRDQRPPGTGGCGGAGSGASGQARHPGGQADGPALRRESPSVAPRSMDGPGRESPARQQLQGKELSYNNLVDLDAAWQLVSEFERPPWRSSSTPIRAAAPSRIRSRRPTARRSKPIRCRLTAASSASIARWTRRRRARSRRPSSRRSPRRITRRKPWPFWARRRICA